MGGWSAGHSHSHPLQVLGAMPGGGLQARNSRLIWVFFGWAVLVNVCLYAQVWQRFHGYILERLRLLLTVLP
jgi:hypothetical protein